MDRLPVHYPHRGPVMWSSDVFFVVSMGNIVKKFPKCLVKWSMCDATWRSCNAWIHIHTSKCVCVFLSKNVCSLHNICIVTFFCTVSTDKENFSHRVCHGRAFPIFGRWQRTFKWHPSRWGRHQESQWRHPCRDCRVSPYHTWRWPSDRLNFEDLYLFAVLWRNPYLTTQSVRCKFCVLSKQSIFTWIYSWNAVINREILSAIIASLKRYWTLQW